MWRSHPLFVYGWLPVRLLATGLGMIACGLLWLALFLQWLSPNYATRIVKGAL